MWHKGRAGLAYIEITEKKTELWTSRFNYQFPSMTILARTMFAHQEIVKR